MSQMGMWLMTFQMSSIALAHSEGRKHAQENRRKETRDEHASIGSSGWIAGLHGVDCMEWTAINMVLISTPGVICYIFACTMHVPPSPLRSSLLSVLCVLRSASTSPYAVHVHRTPRARARAPRLRRTPPARGHAGTTRAAPRASSSRSPPPLPLSLFNFNLFPAPAPALLLLLRCCCCCCCSCCCCARRSSAVRRSSSALCAV